MLAARCHLLIASALILTILTGCSSPLSSPDVRIKIGSLPVRIAFAAGGATLEVLAEEFTGVKIDTNDLLSQIFPSLDPSNGTPSGNNPVLMVVSKKTNDIMYWQITKSVKMIRLKHDRPGAIELKVVNDSPLRIELWVEGDIKSIDIDIELKE